MQGDGSVIRRLQRSTDFERVLKTRSRAASLHFAVHHLAERPAHRLSGAAALEAAGPTELSTSRSPEAQRAVEGAVWWGAVVPKRHARRAVTRTLLKRQIRSVVGERAGALATGLWVVRLRAPFDRAQFASAASDALRRQARSELQQVLASAVERLQRR